MSRILRRVFWIAIVVLAFFFAPMVSAACGPIMGSGKDKPQPFPKPDKMLSVSLDGFAEGAWTLSNEQKEKIKKVGNDFENLYKKVGIGVLHFELTGWYDSEEKKEIAVARLESVRGYLHTDCDIALEIIQFKEASLGPSRAVTINIMK